MCLAATVHYVLFVGGVKCFPKVYMLFNGGVKCIAHGLCCLLAM